MSRNVSVTCPFLYPAFFKPRVSYSHFDGFASHAARRIARLKAFPIRQLSNAALETHSSSSQHVNTLPSVSPLETSSNKYTNPSPDDYSITPFVDSCTITISSGHGGNGCVSFLRDKYTIDGPPNGGDGGTGGNIFIRAVQGHTSLHKIARQGTFRAGRGRGGMGKSQGGRRGEDVVIEVPIGTVVREVERRDPTIEEQEKRNSVGEAGIGEQANRLVFYPGGGRDEQRRMKKDMERNGLRMPDFGPRRSHLKNLEPELPIRLDLDTPMSQPLLLAAGGIGGLGNPHFATREVTRPKIASRGELGVKVKLELELKLLADIGLVGLPNAGKSTLLRSISNSRTRVGNWAFTTLEPKIGTVILDDHKGRPKVRSLLPNGEPRTSFTIADIPGLIEGAHLDRGLGLGFLRHIERARILAFVVDLNATDAVAALQNLWKEVSEYERLRNEEINRDSEQRLVSWNPFTSVGGGIKEKSGSTTPGVFHMISGGSTNTTKAHSHLSRSSTTSTPLTPLTFSPISSKPWFVVATKADLSPSSTQANFSRLTEYLAQVQAGDTPHPSGHANAWKRNIRCLPVSALRGEGVGEISGVVAGLLDGV